MTIKEAMKKGLTKLKLPEWNSSAYVELTKLEAGKYGPWVTLYDSGTKTQMLWAHIEGEGYENFETSQS